MIDQTHAPTPSGGNSPATCRAPGHFIGLAAIGALLAMAGLAQAATVSLATPVLRSRQTVVVIVSGVTAPVGGWSDLAPKSISVRPNKGTAVLDLGPVPGPGTFFVHLVLAPGGATYDALLFVLPAARGEGLELTLLDASAKARPADDAGKALAHRFFDGLTAARMKQAALNVVRPWLAKNAVAITTTVVVCAIPGEQIACVFSAGGLVVDLSFDVLTEAVNLEQKDGLISAAEARKLRVILGLSGGAIAVALPGQNRLDRLLTAAQMTEMLIDDPAGKLFIRYGTDEAKKFNMLLQLRPK